MIKEKTRRGKATAPATKYEDFMRDRLRWKFPSDDLFLDVEAETAYDKIIEWLQFFKVNKETLIFHSVADLPEIEGSALIIDKSMASTKYFEQLSEIKNYKGVIITCDRALYSVIKHRLPNYTCNLDSSFLCVDFFDRPDVKKVMDKITGVFAVTTNTLTIRHWHGKRVFFVPYLGCLSLTKALMLKSGMPYMQTGGQVASFCWLLAYNLGASNIGVFGVTHGYDDMSETEYPGVPHKRVKGPYGTVWQDPVYGWYNDIWLDYIRQASEEGVTTYNLMKAGLLYSKHVKDMSLKEFTEKY